MIFDTIGTLTLNPKSITMYSDIQIKKIIEKSFSEIKYPNSPAELYEPMAYCFSMPGKRIRSTLALMTCNLFTETLANHAIMPALGIEVFHGFTLVHDDIMDNADLRRNQETVHKRWNANIAILLGDAISIEAYKFLCMAEISKIPDILNCFNQAATNVCEGQQYDMNFENKNVITEAEYLKMIELKTAVLISVSMRIGAIVGDATSEDIEHAASAGLYLGMAFQIQDDLLDTYSHTHTIGKVVGSDIANNKKTFLLTTAMNLASADQRRELEELLVAGMTPDDKFTRVKSIYDHLGVRQLAELKVKEYFDAAIQEIDHISVQPEQKEILKGYISKLITRQS